MSYYRFFSPYSAEKSKEYIITAIQRIGKLVTVKDNHFVGKWKKVAMIGIKFTFDLVELEENHTVCHVNTSYEETQMLQRWNKVDDCWSLFVDEITRICPEIKLSNDHEIARALYVEATGGTLFGISKGQRKQMVDDGLLVKVQFKNGRISSGLCIKDSELHKEHLKVYEDQLKVERALKKKLKAGEISEEEYFKEDNKIWEFHLD